MTTPRTRPPDRRPSSPFQRFRPSSTTPTFSFPFDDTYDPDDPDYGDTDSMDQHIRDADDDDDDEDYESSGSRSSRTHRGRIGSPSLTGSSILSDDVTVDGRRPKVFPAPPVHTTSGGRGHQRHVVSVTSSSTSGSGSVRFAVVTSFLALVLAAAAVRLNQMFTNKIN